MKPFRCPICLGCGQVPGGFYVTLMGHVQQWCSGSAAEQCRQCVGTGLIWGREDSNEEN